MALGVVGSVWNTDANFCGLNLEGTNGDEQYDPLPFSSPRILLRVFV